LTRNWYGATPKFLKRCDITITGTQLWQLRMVEFTGLMKRWQLIDNMKTTPLESQVPVLALVSVKLRRHQQGGLLFMSEVCRTSVRRVQLHANYQLAHFGGYCSSTAWGGSCA
jgi:hypothetical protein